MEFRSGMLGAVLIVLSLIASAILGVVLNVDRSTITVEEPVYQSDITGLYQAENQESYIRYDASGNYNGYTWNDSTEYPVDFVPAANANNYPLTKTREGPRDMDPFSDFGSISNIPWRTGISSEATLWVSAIYGFRSEGSQGEYTATPPELVRFIRLSDAISEMEPDDTDELNVIRMIIDVTKLRQINQIFPNNMTAIAPFYATSGYDVSTSQRSWIIGPKSEVPYVSSFFENLRINETKTVCTVDYYVSTGKCAVYSGEVNPANLIGNYDATALYIYSYGTVQADSIIPIPNNNIHVEYIYDSGTQYIDPRYGVANIYENTEIVTWQNGYANQRLDLTVATAINTTLIPDYEGDEKIVIDSGNDYYNEWTFYYGKTGNDLSNEAFTVSMTSPPGGPLTITVLDNSAEPQILGTLDLGTGWVGANIRFDGKSGTINVQPIAPSGWGNFLEWNSTQPYQKVSDIPVGSVYGYTVNNTNDIAFSFRWQISETYVFLNTYGVIMMDPVVNIRNWYPNNDKFMISFFKTAATGESITIGGQEYLVSQNEITIPQTEDDVKIDITEYNVTYILLSTTNGVDTWEITIESPKSGTSATVQGTTTEIAMDGAWYFNSNYYVIEDVEKDVYNWQFGNLAFGINVMFLFMMGFLAIGTIAVWKLIPGILTAFDIGIVIIAEIILFLIAG